MCGLLRHPRPTSIFTLQRHKRAAGKRVDKRGIIGRFVPSFCWHRNGYFGAVPAGAGHGTKPAMCDLSRFISGGCRIDHTIGVVRKGPRIPVRGRQIGIAGIKWRLALVDSEVKWAPFRFPSAPDYP
jgi:hypothetical protein